MMDEIKAWNTLNNRAMSVVAVAKVALEYGGDMQVQDPDAANSGLSSSSKDINPLDKYERACFVSGGP